jgi:hypothetical protein
MWLNIVTPVTVEDKKTLDVSADGPSRSAFAQLSRSNRVISIRRHARFTPYCIPQKMAYDLLRCTIATTDAEIKVNFVTAVVVTKPVPCRHSLVAVHHQRAARPIARHAYRLSQVITYGVAPPQTYVH